MRIRPSSSCAQLSAAQSGGRARTSSRPSKPLLCSICPSHTRSFARHWPVLRRASRRTAPSAAHAGSSESPPCSLPREPLANPGIHWLWWSGTNETTHPYRGLVRQRQLIASPNAPGRTIACFMEWYSGREVSKHYGAICHTACIRGSRPRKNGCLGAPSPEGAKVIRAPIYRGAPKRVKY